MSAFIGNDCGERFAGADAIPRHATLVVESEGEFAKRFRSDGQP